MTSRSTARSILGTLALSVLAFPLACGGGQAGPPGSTASSQSGECKADPKSAPECSAPSQAKAFEVSGGGTKQEDIAIGRINDQIQKLSTEQARLCGDYASCAIDEGGLRKGSASIKERMDSLPPLIDAMKNAKTYGQKKRALDELYRGVVPAEQRVEELTFRMGMNAELPASAGGKMVDVEPGAALPTNARVTFSFEVSRDAYLYIFQKAPNGTVNVLFPDARIGTQNPLRGSASAAIPPNGQRFRLNDQDLGVENVYLVASREPIQSLDSALQKVKEGKVTQIAQDSMLKAFTAVQPGTAPAGCKTRALELEPSATEGPACTRSRGLVLDADAAPAAAQKRVEGGAPSSFTGRAVMEVRTDPGDSVIVKVFPFKHVSEQDYGVEAKAVAGEPKGVKTRALVIEF